MVEDRRLWSDKDTCSYGQTIIDMLFLLDFAVVIEQGLLLRGSLGLVTLVPGSPSYPNCGSCNLTSNLLFCH